MVVARCLIARSAVSLQRARSIKGMFALMISRFQRRLHVVGDTDGATPPALVEEFANSIPGADFELVVGSGHLPCVERTDRFIEIVRELAHKVQGESQCMTEC